jgi:hypothetical protein
MGESEYTELWYVLAYCLRSDGDWHRGCWYWPCPKCGDNELHTMPHKRAMRDRWFCWRCSPERTDEFRGDAFDALRLLHDNQLVRDNYGARLLKFSELQRDYNRRFHNLKPRAAGSGAERNGQATAQGEPVYRPGDSAGSIIPLTPYVQATLTTEQIEGVLWARDFCQRHDMDLERLADLIERHTN